MDNSKILCVQAVEYLRDYMLLIHFNNGEDRVFDFSKVFHEGILCKLQDKEYFLNYSLDPFTIDWNNEIGFAPEFLYENGTTA